MSKDLNISYSGPDKSIKRSRGKPNQIHKNYIDENPTVSVANVFKDSFGSYNFGDRVKCSVVAGSIIFTFSDEKEAEAVNNTLQGFNNLVVKPGLIDRARDALTGDAEFKKMDFSLVRTEKKGKMAVENPNQAESSNAPALFTSHSLVVPAASAELFFTQVLHLDKRLYAKMVRDVGYMQIHQAEGGDKAVDESAKAAKPFKAKRFKPNQSHKSHNEVGRDTKGWVVRPGSVSTNNAPYVENIPDSTTLQEEDITGYCAVEHGKVIPMRIVNEVLRQDEDVVKRLADAKQNPLNNFFTKGKRNETPEERSARLQAEYGDFPGVFFDKWTSARQNADRLGVIDETVNKFSYSPSEKGWMADEAVLAFFEEVERFTAYSALSIDESKGKFLTTKHKQNIQRNLQKCKVELFKEVCESLNNLAGMDEYTRELNISKAIGLLKTIDSSILMEADQIKFLEQVAKFAKISKQIAGEKVENISADKDLDDEKKEAAFLDNVNQYKEIGDLLYGHAADLLLTLPSKKIQNTYRGSDGGLKDIFNLKDEPKFRKFVPDYGVFGDRIKDFISRFADAKGKGLIKDGVCEGSVGPLHHLNIATIFLTPEGEQESRKQTFFGKSFPEFMRTSGGDVSAESTEEKAEERNIIANLGKQYPLCISMMIDDKDKDFATDILRVSSSELIGGIKMLTDKDPEFLSRFNTTIDIIADFRKEISQVIGKEKLSAFDLLENKRAQEVFAKYEKRLVKGIIEDIALIYPDVQKVDKSTGEKLKTNKQLYIEKLSVVAKSLNVELPEGLSPDNSVGAAPDSREPYYPDDSIIELDEESIKGLVKRGEASRESRRGGKSVSSSPDTSEDLSTEEKGKGKAPAAPAFEKTQSLRDQVSQRPQAPVPPSGKLTDSQPASAATGWERTTDRKDSNAAKGSKIGGSRPNWTSKPEGRDSSPEKDEGTSSGSERRGKPFLGTGRVRD